MPALVGVGRVACSASVKLNSQPRDLKPGLVGFLCPCHHSYVNTTLSRVPRMLCWQWPDIHGVCCSTFCLPPQQARLLHLLSAGAKGHTQWSQHIYRSSSLCSILPVLLLCHAMSVSCVCLALLVLPTPRWNRLCQFDKAVHVSCMLVIITAHGHRMHNCCVWTSSPVLTQVPRGTSRATPAVCCM